MTNNDTQKPLGQRIWKFLASVKLTFVLLLSLAAASVAGTIILQHEPAARYLTLYGQNWGNLILGFGLDDAYHTWWYRLLLATLAVNLLVCSLDRLPQTLKIVRKDPREDLQRGRKPNQSFTLAGGVDEYAGLAKEKLKHALGEVYANSSEESVKLFAQKGAWTRLGVYAVHASVLIIFAGALVGNFFGFSGRINIFEGQTANSIQSYKGGDIPLDFSMRLDKFTINFYKDGMPSDYISNLVFSRNGKVIRRHVLKVNHPAVIEGIDFYQASYGEMPGNVKVRVTTKDGRTADVELQHRTWTKLPMGGQAGVIEYRKHVAMGKMYQGPLARLAYQPPGGEAKGVTAFKAGSKISMGGDIKFEILSAQERYYSGISVKYDPGVWFIWVGCTVMVIGFFFTFYSSHKKVWISLEPDGGNRTRVEMAYSTNKNRPAAKKLLRRLALELGAENLSEV